MLEVTHHCEVGSGYAEADGCLVRKEADTLNL